MSKGMWYFVRLSGSWGVFRLGWAQLLICGWSVFSGLVGILSCVFSATYPYLVLSFIDAYPSIDSTPVQTYRL